MRQGMSPNAPRLARVSDDRPLYYIINFAITAANHGMSIRWGILDAGILDLVPFAFVDGVASSLSGLLELLEQQSNRHSPSQHKRSSGDLDEPNTTALPLNRVDAEASMLLLYIQEPRFQKLLCSEMFALRCWIHSS